MAIHYFFESEHKLKMYLKNVSDRLRPGGYFIGTTIDSDELVYRVRSSGRNDNTIQNDFLKVVLPQDSFPKDQVFGLKYYFYLREAIGKSNQSQERLVDEFLVIFPILIKMANDVGLELEMKKNFRQYYDDKTSYHPASGIKELYHKQIDLNMKTFERFMSGIK
jgi:mRNA (guanine-N7-)-methyltransferase